MTADYKPDSLSILGAPISVFSSYNDAVQFVHRRISSHLPSFCVAMNPEKIYRARSDARLSRALQSATIRICDGIGVSLAAKLLYRKRLPRCTGVDLFQRLLELSAREGWKVFLLGASPESNSGACKALLKAYPDLKIAGRQDGYFEDSAAVVEKINTSGADLLFVGLGSPRQEYWIAEQMPHLRATFCMGIGGSLDVFSGAAKRAPGLFRKTGLEWLFRLVVQPGRLRRQIVLPLFTMEILRAMRRG